MIINLAFECKQGLIELHFEKCAKYQNKLIAPIANIFKLINACETV